MLRYVKTGNKKHCFATLMQNELNSDVARFTTHIKPVLQQIRLLAGLNTGGKTRNIAIQLVLQKCCKTSCTFFVARFPVPLERSVPLRIVVVNCSRPSNIAFREPWQQRQKNVRKKNNMSHEQNKSSLHLHLALWSALFKLRREMS